MNDRMPQAYYALHPYRRLKLLFSFCIHLFKSFLHFISLLVGLTQYTGLHSGVVVSTVASQRNGCWFGWGLAVWSLHVPPVHVWLLSGYSVFLPLSKNMYIRLNGDSKLTLGVCVSVWLLFFFCVGPGVHYWL